MKPNTDDLVAAFLAKGGQIKKLDVTATNGMTAKDWQRAERGEKPLTVAQTDEDAEWRAEQRAEQYREAAHMGGTAAVNELMEMGI